MLILSLLTGVAPMAAPQVAPSPAPLHFEIPRTDDDVATLVLRGRRLLGAEQFEEAESQFQQAFEQEGSLENEAWILRAWIGQGRANKALARAEALAKEGAKGPALDYVYGMAFHSMAMADIAGGGGSSTAYFLSDAITKLKSATDANSTLYADGLLALAEAGWYGQDLETARTAIDQVQRTGVGGVLGGLLLGRIAISQYVQALNEEVPEDEAMAHWKASVKGFQAAIDYLEARGDAEDNPMTRTELADAHVELARTLLWQAVEGETSQDALDAFLEAIAWDPARVDFNEVQGRSKPGEYPDLLSRAAERFSERHPRGDTGDALIHWWRGFALFGQRSTANHRDAIAAFEKALGRNPDYTTSWYYIAHARGTLQDWKGVDQALKTYAEINEDELIASLQSDAVRSRTLLYNVIGQWWMDSEAQGGEVANEEAAWIAELLTRVLPEMPGHWSDLGLFLRDAGDAMRWPGGRRNDEAPNVDGEDAELRKKRTALWERSLEAYEQALSLAPTDANILNDTAILLDYNLNRELDRAEELYRKAGERATEELTRTDLTPDQRSNFQTVQTDARNNIARLQRRRERAKEKPQGEGEGDGAGDGDGGVEGAPVGGGR